MLKKILAAMLALFAAVAFAAVDANKATPAELDGVKGIGPVIAGKIVDERKNGAYKDWNDLITRVKGVGEGNAAKFSAEGLTVNGTTYQGATPSAKPTKPAKDGDAATKAAKKAEQSAATAVGAASAPAATSADAKAEAKKQAAEKRAAAKKEKEEKAAAAKAEKEAKAASAADSKKKRKDKAQAAAGKASDAKTATK